MEGVALDKLSQHTEDNNEHLHWLKEAFAQINARENEFPFEEQEHALVSIASEIELKLSKMRLQLEKSEFGLDSERFDDYLSQVLGAAHRLQDAERTLRKYRSEKRRHIAESKSAFQRRIASLSCGAFVKAAEVLVMEMRLEVLSVLRGLPEIRSEREQQEVFQDFGCPIISKPKLAKTLKIKPQAINGWMRKGSLIAINPGGYPVIFKLESAITAARKKGFNVSALLEEFENHRKQS
jgi:hypothetical protein